MWICGVYRISEGFRNLVEDGTLRYQHMNLFDREMHSLESRHAFCRPHLHQWITVHHNQDKVIAFEKGDGLLFVFNFHPVNSFTDYSIGVLWPVSYFYMCLVEV